MGFFFCYFFLPDDKDISIFTSYAVPAEAQAEEGTKRRLIEQAPCRGWDGNGQSIHRAGLEQGKLIFSK